jgi:hypothetical protein
MLHVLGPGGADAPIVKAQYEIAAISEPTREIRVVALMDTHGRRNQHTAFCEGGIAIELATQGKAIRRAEVVGILAAPGRVYATSGRRRRASTISIRYNGAAKLSEIESEAYLRYVFEHIAEHPIDSRQDYGRATSLRSRRRCA